MEGLERVEDAGCRVIFTTLNIAINPPETSPSILQLEMLHTAFSLTLPNVFPSPYLPPLPASLLP